MTETIVRTWPEELLAEGIAEGELRASRANLQMLLEKRFGTLPEALVQRIEETSDLERLRNALAQVLDLTTLEELAL